LLKQATLLPIMDFETCSTFIQETLLVQKGQILYSYCGIVIETLLANQVQIQLNLSTKGLQKATRLSTTTIIVEWK